MEKDLYTIDEKIVYVGQGHKLYSQLWGNNNAKQTIVFLHGGPGSGCSNQHKQLFNPVQHRVIFFDQRGSGRSLPYGCLKNNDTDSLAQDINLITKAYDVDTFVVTGGSWGSCLALIYAVRYPEKVKSMVIRGIFTGREFEIDHMDRGPVKLLFPDVWESFINSVPDKYKSDPRSYHMPRLFGANKAGALKSAMAYAALQVGLISLDDRNRPIDPDTFDPIPITIECHYLVNRCFIPEGYILNNAAKLNMPIAIIQGRYDALCLPITAYELNKALPNSKLFWTIAGHSGGDRSNNDLAKALLSDI